MLSISNLVNLLGELFIVDIAPNDLISQSFGHFDKTHGQNIGLYLNALFDLLVNQIYILSVLQLFLKLLIGKIIQQRLGNCLLILLLKHMALIIYLLYLLLELLALDELRVEQLLLCE